MARGQKALLIWSQRICAAMGVMVKDFKKCVYFLSLTNRVADVLCACYYRSWRDGKAYLALFAYYCHRTIDWLKDGRLDDDSDEAILHRLELAFSTGEAVSVLLASWV